MTMKGTGASHGAATIVNAIANGKGAAFGLDLRTEATVELTEGSGFEVVMDGLPGESTALAERCVLGVLERVGGGRRYHAKITTRSQIPVSRGLKSSSAAANAIIFAALDALDAYTDQPDDPARMVPNPAKKTARNTVARARTPIACRSRGSRSNASRFAVIAGTSRGWDSSPL